MIRLFCGSYSEALDEANGRRPIDIITARAQLSDDELEIGFVYDLYLENLRSFESALEDAGLSFERVNYSR